MQNSPDDILPYSTARGTLYMIARTLAAGLSTAIFFILVARLLPHVSDLGLVNGLQILITVAVVLSNLGLSTATPRFMSYYIGAGKDDLAKNIGILVFRIGLLSSIIISLVLYLSAYYLATALFHQIAYFHLIQLSSIDVFLTSMISFSTFILLSLHQFKKVAVVLILNSLIRYTVAFVMLAIGAGIKGIIIGFIIGDLISLIHFLYVLRHQISGPSRNFPDGIRGLFRYSLPLFVSNTLSYFSMNADFYLVLILSSLSIAGIYSPAVFIATMLATIGGALEQTLVPYFSRVFGKGGIESLKEISKLGSRYLFLLYFPIGFATLASVYPIITGIFGFRYVDSIYPSVVLILGITLTSVGLLFNSILKSVGHTKAFLTSTSIALLVQFIMSIGTIPVIGATGAAIARSAAYAIMFVIPAYKLREIGGLHYDFIALRNGLVGSIVMGSIIFILNLYLSNPYYLPLNLSIGFLSYLILLRYTNALSLQDFEIINKVLSGKLKSPISVIMKLTVR